MHWSSLDEAMTDGHGIERSFLCPVHGDTHPSASVNSVTGLWICYTCGARGRYDTGALYTDPYQVGRILKAMTDRAEFNPRQYSERWLDIFDALPSPYWRSRFSPEVIAAHRLGQDPNSAYATIPMRDGAGTVLGVIKRDLTGQSKSKYHYPFGVSVRQHLYNLHRCTGPVLIVVEGATDVVAANEVGVEAVALYGSTMSRSQALLLTKYAPSLVVVAVDQDRAGEGAWESINRELYGFVPVSKLDWDTYSDLAAIPTVERAEMLSRWALDTLVKGGSVHA